MCIRDRDYPGIREKGFTETGRATEVRRQASRSGVLLYFEAHETYPLGPSSAGKPSKVLSLTSTSFPPLNFLSPS